MKTEIKKFKLFLDETGDHGLAFVDENYPIFLLAGCLFEEVEYQKVTQEFEHFKTEFFKTKEVILHSRDIRKCEGSFQILFDLELKKRFYERMNSIISLANFKIIAVAIDKKKYIEEFGKITQDPYAICLSHILEKLISCIGEKDDSKVAIVIEKRGLKEDKQLLAAL